MRTGSRGFTTIELLVALTLLGILLAGGISLMLTGSQLYTVQRESRDAAMTIRGAGAMLASELRSIAASDGDLVEARDTAVTIRALQAAGVVCAHDTTTTTEKFALRQVTGQFSATPDDSVLLYDAENDAWVAGSVDAAWNGSDAWTSGGMDVCFWGDSTISAPRPEAAVELSAPGGILNSLQLGSAVRAFRRTTYATYQDDGRWWLGRRVGAGGYTTLTGPLLPPPDSGLNFGYYDDSGNPTTIEANVARIQILLQSASFGEPSSLGGQAVEDSLGMTVYLRNN